MNAVDLFAGVGGWDLAARSMGIDPLGIEKDEWACATRNAANLRTLKGDVRLIKATDFPCDLLIASPPCQYFSTSAPRRKIVSTTAYNIARRDKWRAYSDEGPKLVSIPLEWALMLQPPFIAFEQVATVISIWETQAEALQRAGYFTWTGVLDAADYGVPQTRRRAILMARRLLGPISSPKKLLRSGIIHPTVVCNRRSAGGIVIGRSLKQGGKAVTFAEAGAIQTFPSDYPWKGGVEKKSTQIGNAIPPNLAKAILIALFA